MSLTNPSTNVPWLECANWDFWSTELFVIVSKLVSPTQHNTSFRKRRIPGQLTVLVLRTKNKETKRYVHPKHNSDHKNLL